MITPTINIANNATAGYITMNTIFVDFVFRCSSIKCHFLVYVIQRILQFVAVDDGDIVFDRIHVVRLMAYVIQRIQDFRILAAI